MRNNIVKTLSYNLVLTLVIVQKIYAIFFNSSFGIQKY